MLVIRRIHVTYHLKSGEEHRETVERVHALHAERCPVFKTLESAIDITTEFILET